MKVSKLAEELLNRPATETVTEYMDENDTQGVKSFYIPEKEIKEVIDGIKKLEERTSWDSEENQKARDYYKYKNAYEFLVKELINQGVK